MSLISEAIVHPDTISKKFKETGYRFHDLRRTFSTNMAREGKHREDLRLALGHASMVATEKFYIMDDRAMEDEVYIP